MRFILYLRGVNESHLVYRPVNVFFRVDGSHEGGCQLFEFL